MGENNRFFTWLWRFNALLLALLGLLLATFIISNISPRFFPAHNDAADNFLAEPHAPSDNVSYQLEAAGTSLNGTADLVFGLQRSSGPTSRNALRISSGGGPYPDVNTVNLLVVDGSDSSSHWLFKGVDRIIWSDSSDHVREIVASDIPKSPVVALVIETATAHPDKTGTLTVDGPETLYFYRLGGNGTFKFFSADNVRSIVQIDADRLLVVYENVESIGAATFSTKDFKLISQSPVPSVPK